MTVFTSKVDLVWEYSYDNKYKFDKDGNCYNCQRGTKLKRTLIGYTEGYCLNGKFKSLKQIRNKLVKIVEYKCPFWKKK